MSELINNLFKVASSKNYSNLPSDLQISVECEKALLGDFVSDIKKITAKYLYSQDSVQVDMLLNSEILAPFPAEVYPALDNFDKLVELYNEGYTSFESLDVGLQTYEFFSDGNNLEYYQSEEAVNFLFSELLLLKVGIDDVDALIDLGHISAFTSVQNSRNFVRQLESLEKIEIDATKYAHFVDLIEPIINYEIRDFALIEKDLREFHIHHKFLVN